MATKDSQQATQTSTASEGSITGNDTFSAGATLTSQLNFISDGMNFYYWTGAFDKVVPAGSTPDDTGGVGDGAWKVAGDAAIRAELGSSGGGKYIGLKYGALSDTTYYYTPEMFGALGDGNHDDYSAIQEMLNAMPSGACAIFNPTKKYYNAYAINGLPGSWKITKPCIIDFNGALVTRKTPVISVDNQSALFFINSTSGVKLLNINLDGNNPLGAPVDGNGNTVITDKITSLCQCIDYGIYILSSSEITITGKIQCCAFNVWTKSSSRLNADIILDYAGQVIPNVSITDLAYGAGIKLSDSSDFYLNATGKGNANATIEIEPACNNGRGICNGSLNLSSSLTITDSRNMHFTNYAYRTNIGCQLIQTASTDNERNLRNIIVDNISENCSWSLLLSQRTNAVLNAKNITINNISENAGTYGLYIYNQSSIPILNLLIDHNSRNTAFNTLSTAGNDIVVTGDVRCLVRGSAANVYNGLLVNGAQNPTTPPRFNLDLREVTNAIGYSIDTSSYADMSGSINQSEFMLTSSARNIRLARMLVGGNYGVYSDFVMRGTNFYIQGIATTASYNNQAWVDTTNSNVLKVNL
ncbi:hypothetical protein [Gibbsiella quercinecans]|uniref:tail fiber/spike domain-containing protein n=1 Tax=Gibbsiella quercinecans TaxID=929813 RepID=UPI0011C3D33B|nr:hypothetical protein [Gibbsiella quercinecans]